MSNEVSTLVQKRLVGSATKKSVLMYLADRASDDGTGVWTSKHHIAADTELSKRSVQNSMTDFERDGIIRKTGKKKCPNGYTYEYAMDIEVIKLLSGTRKVTGAGGAPVQVVHVTGAGGAPQDVQVVHPNLPLTTLEPSNTPNPKGDDLFSADNELTKTDRTSEAIEAGFNEFWDEIWPKHIRKSAMFDCRRVYDSACRGKHKKAAKISPTELNRCARAYIASVKDLQYLKGPLPWLRKPGWEPFLDGQVETKPQSYAQRVLAAAKEGRVV